MGASLINPTRALAPLLVFDRREGCGFLLVTEAELAYARLLYRSGYAPRAIAEVIGQTETMVASAAFRAGWTRGTPVRRGASLGARVPVLVRCPECCARYGEALGQARPCPRCGSTLRGAPAQLDLLDVSTGGTDRSTIGAEAVS